MSKKVIGIFILFVILCSSVFSQVHQEWVAVYSSQGIYDFVNKIVADDSGNVYISGSINNPGSYDYATIKYNTNGAQQWVAIYDGSSEDRVTDMTIDRWANIYVTGYTYNMETDDDYLTIKYNSSGVQQWIARYNDTSGSYYGPTIHNDQAYGVSLDSTGNVFVLGSSGTIKYDSSGVQIWVVKDRIFPNDITTDISGNVYITGFSDTSLNGSRDFATIKYNFFGIRQWISRYNGIGNTLESANSIAVDVSGNVYVTGYIENNLESDYLTIKYNSSGLLQWIDRYGGSSDDNAYSIAVDVFGNVIVNGSINRGNPATIWDYATIKYDSSGLIQWYSTYNGTGNWADQATDMILDNLGNIYVTGYSVGIGTHHDYATIKYNPSGVQQWAERYNGPFSNNDEPYSLTLDKRGNIYVTGVNSPNGNGNLDFTTVKYSQVITQTNTLSNGLSQPFNLYQNYPNPFNPNTVISYQLPVSSFVKIKVYDVLGNEVATLVNEKQNAGSYSVEFDAGNYPSGIYYYKLEAGDFSEVKKMILLK